MALKLAFDREKFYVYPWYIADMTSTHDMEDIIGDKMEKVFATIRNDFVSLYFEELSTNRIGEKFLDKIIESEAFFKKIIKEIYSKGDDLLGFCEGLKKKKLADLSDEDLLDIYQEYMEKLREMRKWGFIPPFLDGVFVSFLTERVMEELGLFLEKKGRGQELPKLYSTLSSSEKESEVQTEELARLDILLEVESLPQKHDALELIKQGRAGELKEKYPDLFEKMEEHTKEFGWLPYAYEGPTMGIAYLLEALKDNLSKKETAQEQKGRIVNHFKNIKKEKAEIIKELNIPDNIVYLLRVSSELMFVKDQRKGIYQKSYVAMDPVLEEIAKRLDMSLKEIKYMVLEEVIDAVRNNKASAYKEKVKQRLVECCYVVVDGKINIYEGEEAKQVIEKEIKNVVKEEPVPETDTLKGMTAFSGRAKGTVKIVLVKEDVPKVEDGDILVSSATNPDLIMAMKKAAAFVTDTGGIVSHAAIVSRELKKPCVVGTKFATKLLKDGDTVEVRADEGLVKILKKE